MVRLAFMVTVLVGAAFSALTLPASAMAHGPASQDVTTTLGIQGEVLEAATFISPKLGLVCKAPGTDDESHGCAGKTLVSATLPSLPMGIGVSPRENPPYRNTSGALIPMDLQPPKPA